ncbi:hypothetical protein ACOMDP_21975 [Pantoea dispersa]|uniref:hypothetical protein n=1 Tax=Pantoea dispersa TaxID=59814 RepID=UPI003B79D25A
MSMKKTQVSYSKPSRMDIVRSVATSTAVETGQSSEKIEVSLEATRKNSPIFALPNPFLMHF